MSTTTETDIKALRQTVLNAVEEQARQDGIKQKEKSDTLLICRDRITVAFGEAGLLDTVGGLNRMMMLADFAKQMADRLHSR